MHSFRLLPQPGQLNNMIACHEKTEAFLFTMLLKMKMQSEPCLCVL